MPESRYTAWEIATEAAEREGWSDETLIGVICDYIQNQGSNDAFIDYLNER